MNVPRDLKYAARLLAKKPGFTLLTTMVMAAGIGLSLYLFSIVHTMLYKDLPFADSESMVILRFSENGVRQNWGLNLKDLHAIRENVEGLSEFNMYMRNSVNVSGRDGARRYNAVSITPGLFQYTRTDPALGRGFTEAESREGAEHVVIIGNRMWRNRFAADAGIIGQNVKIDGIGHRIVGVMPDGYVFPDNADMWRPIRQNPAGLARSEAGTFFGAARLEPGYSMRDINRQLDVVMQRIEERYPETNKGIGAYVDTYQMGNTGGEAMNVVYCMFTAAVLILLLASINVGNLLLSRAVERGKETAIRTALGAPRARLVGLMLWESVIICGLGGVIGLLVLAWGLEVTEAVTATFFPDGSNFWWHFNIDGFTITLFAVFLLSTIFATGLLPAWKNSGGDFNAVLRDGTRGAQGRKAGRLNRILVISEIFLSITILIGAAAMMLSAWRATHADYGVNPRNMVAALVTLGESDYKSPAERVRFVETLQTRLESSGIIDDVMILSALPGEWASRPTMALEGAEYSGGGREYPRANYIAVMPGGLEKLGVELKQGRYFNSGDNGPDKHTVVITDSFASRHFPGETPIGKRLRIVKTENDKPEWLTVVGVVEHTIHGMPSDSSADVPSVFRPFTQAPRNDISFALRTSAARTAVARTLREALASIDPDVAAFRIEPYARKIDRLAGPLRFMSTIFLLFGIAAVVLAASGIYGVMSNNVAQRTQEIGIKRALGAGDEKIAREFLFTGFRQFLWGGVPGLVAGCAMGFAMVNVIKVGQADVLVAGVSLTVVIGMVVLLATWLPTRRALQIEPGDALRYE